MKLSKKIHKGLPYDPLKAMINGQSTSIFAADPADIDIEGADIVASIAHAQERAGQAVANITAFAAQKLGSKMGELVAPPMPSDILGKSMEIMGAYIISPGDIIKELLQTNEAYDENLKEKMLANAVNLFNTTIGERIGGLKDKVTAITDKFTVDIPRIVNNAKQGIEWVDQQIVSLERQAINQIEKTIDDQTAGILKAKSDFIESMSTGLAKQASEKVNAKIRKQTKDKLDEVAKMKEKAMVIAKATAGAALLNIMARLGM